MQQTIWIVVLAGLVSSSMANEFAPVLSRLGVGDQDSGVSVVNHVLAADFKDQLTMTFSGENDVELVLILIKSKEPVTSDAIASQMWNFKLEKDVVFQTEVENPYENLAKFLSPRKDIRVKKILVESVNDGLNQFSQIQHESKPVILLQDASEPIVRQKREAEESTPKQETNITRSFVYGTECAAFFDSVVVLDELKTESPGPVTLPVKEDSLSFSCSGGPSQPQFLTIKFDKNTAVSGKSVEEISFKFVTTNNSLYYMLNQSIITLESDEKHEILYSGAPYYMETPLNFSFACTRTRFQLRFTHPDGKGDLKAMIFIDNLQLQSSGIIPNNTEYAFGQVNYCQGFFSSGIWMAITSSLLLVIILAFGVTALMTIQTNDRLDDPKGKPLNIGVEK